MDFHVRKRKGYRMSITRRWVVDTIVVIGVLLFIFGATASFLIHTSYYDSVEMALDARAGSSGLTTFFSSYLNSSESVFALRAQEFVESFRDTSKMEVWVIDREGEIAATSTGFDPPEGERPDSDAAASSDSGVGHWTGRIDGGEKVMAVTVMLPKTAGESNGAVRFITSLSAVDAQHAKLTVYIFLFCLFSLAMVAVSGVFFIRSIVRPVKNINDAAARIARGEYDSLELEVGGTDEIGELCGTINHMAEEISRTEQLKNDFISTVSHELRTPLTAIKGWAETLDAMLRERNADTQSFLGGLKVIISESDRLYMMVEDLLDFSKMQNGQMTLRLSRMDALAELDETVYVFRDRAKRDDIEVVYESPEQPAIMTGDPDRITQVFVNILDNAVKYTPPGGTITVEPSFRADCLEVVVTDTGRGIAPEDLPRVKEKFFKGGNSERGSGIGLAVCDEIVALHGGELKIDSVPGVGTTVTVTLPLEKKKEA